MDAYQSLQVKLINLQRRNARFIRRQLPSFQSIVDLVSQKLDGKIIRT